MTSWSERPARRARKPPMAWVPSWGLPARRMTTSGIWVAGAGASSPAAGGEGLTIMEWGESPATMRPPHDVVKACFQNLTLRQPIRKTPAGAEVGVDGLMGIDPHTPALRATPLARGDQFFRTGSPLERGVPEGRGVLVGRRR